MVLSKLDEIQINGVRLKEQWYAMTESKQDYRYYEQMPEQQLALHPKGMWDCTMWKLPY